MSSGYFLISVLLPLHPPAAHVSDSGVTCLQVELSRETNNTRNWNITAAYTTHPGSARESEMEKAETEWENSVCGVDFATGERKLKSVRDAKNGVNFSIIICFNKHLVRDS